MIGTPYATRCAVLALLVAVAALAWHEARTTCPPLAPVQTITRAAS